MGCRGPTTYNACSTVRWNGGVSFPIQSGHGCIGCSEDNFWDNGPFYQPLAHIGAGFGVEASADEIGAAAAGLVGAGVLAHAGASAIKHFRSGKATPTAKSDDHSRPDGDQP
jgi:hydrogenase small subunit